MTITVGFTCKDGVVLASDTQVGNSTSKANESKIFDLSDNGTCFLGYAGIISRTKEIREELKKTFANAGEGQVVNELKHKIKEIHEEVFTRAAKTEKDWQTLLFAIRTRGCPADS